MLHKLKSWCNLENSGDIIKKSIKIGDHSTSVTLERGFWQVLEKIAQEKKSSIRSLITDIDNKNAGACNLSSAIRIFILQQYI